MKNTLKTVALAMALTSSVFAASTDAEQPKSVYLSIDSDALNFSEKSFGPRVEEVQTLDGISIIKIDEDALPWLSMLMHKNFNRCGGFMLHEHEDEAMELLNSQDGLQSFAKRNYFSFYNINSAEIVKPLIREVKGERIYSDIVTLSSFKNRYYKSKTGVDAAHWIKSHWEKLVEGRSDAKVELFNHSRWDQPSVILTIKGQSDETIIVGGHLDSIAGMWGGANAQAPGADDNASGISTISEIIRVLVSSSYKPEKTIQFIGYAAEEVGLLGSKEIATLYKNENRSVIGVMQLDMTNYKGSKDLDIVLMRDYTNDGQNQFIGGLIDQYLPEIKWGYDRCGYGCSDHASWHSQGFPASMPFEAKKSDMSPYIHSGKDTVESLGNNANHAAKFAKMALAFVVELDR